MGVLCNNNQEKHKKNEKVIKKNSIKSNHSNQDIIVDNINIKEKENNEEKRNKSGEKK